MDTAQLAQDQATQPVPEAVSPVAQQDATAHGVAPHLEQHQGEQTAPAPTSDAGDQSVDASAQSTQPQFDVEEFLRIKQEREEYQRKLEEQDGIIAQIRRMADEQKAAEASQRLRSEIQSEVMADLKRAGIDDEEVAAAIAERMYGRVDGLGQTYQQQMADYQRQVDDYATQAIWAGTRDGFAQYMLSEYKLDPVYLPRLQGAKSQDEMVLIAESIQEAQKFYMNQAYDRTVQAQEDQRRASGVDTVNGGSSGPLDTSGLKPGRNLDVLGAILNGAGAR